MPKWQVTHEDGRTTNVFAPDEPAAKKQAQHQETTRAVIAGKRGFEVKPNPSAPASVKFVKD